MHGILITVSTQWATDLYIWGATSTKEFFFNQTYQQSIKHAYSFIRMEMHVSDYLKEKFLLFWGPFLSFWNEKMSSGRKSKHSSLTVRQSQQVHVRIPPELQIFSCISMGKSPYLSHTSIHCEYNVSSGSSQCPNMGHHGDLNGCTPQQTWCHRNMCISKGQVLSSAKLEDWGWFLGSWLVSNVTLTLIHPELLDTGEQQTA